MDFDAGTAAHDTDFFDARVREIFHFLTGNLFDMPDLAHIIVTFKDLDSLKCNGTGKWISHKGRTVHQGKAVIVTIKSVKDFVVCNGDSMSDITAGQGFSENQDVRKDKVGYKAVSGTSESCCNLIKIRSTSY